MRLHKYNLILATIMVLGLTGCMVGPNFVRPKPPASDHFNRGGDAAQTSPAEGVAQHFIKGAEPSANWWQQFNSSKLNEIVHEGLANNQTLQAAQASLRQSSDYLKAGYGVFYPQLGGELDANRQKFSPARFGSTSPSSIFNLFTLSASVSYALDAFGGERRLIENLRSQVDEQRAITIGTYVTLSGNIVNTAIALAAYREQLADIKETTTLLKNEIQITETQEKAGIVSYEKITNLQNQLASMEATIPPLTLKTDQAEHLLAVLSGHLTSDWKAPHISMSDLTLPAMIPVSLPSKFVEQRPDIMAAEAKLHAASANIGIATAALFPNFILSGSFGQNATSTGRLFASNSNIWNIGGNITAPLFNGGTLLAEKQAAIDAYQQSLDEYHQTVILAFAQVADILRALEHDAETLQADADATNATADSLQLLNTNYMAGTINDLDVIAARIQYYQAKLSQDQAIAQRFQDTTALFVALGGGGWKKSTLTARQK